MGGRGAVSENSYSLAVRENPSYKKEIGKAQYAVRITEDGTISTINFNDTTRTDNNQKSNHAIDAYNNMKIYQKSDNSNIYLITKEQMNNINKKMPTYNELRNNKEATISKIETLLKNNSNKIIKPKKQKSRKRKNDLPF